MKKLIIALLALACVAAIMPPKLPSGFYGDVTGKLGQVITVKSDGVTLASTNVILWEGKPVYHLLVPMDNVDEGAMAVFYVNGKIAGRAYLHSGTNVRLDLQTIVFRRYIMPLRIVE